MASARLKTPQLVARARTAHRKGRDKIEPNAVLEAARQWFEQDKERNLDERLRAVLRRITDEVIGDRKARSFLLPHELAAHPLIQRLFDLRVLHLVQRGYADKDRPGVRYNIYTLDYGNCWSAFGLRARVGPRSM